MKIEKLSEPALAVGHCIGTIDLRGATVPIVDFASLLNYRPMDRTEAATSGDRRIVVMRLENELFGLMVDSVDSIISYFDDELLQFPVIEQQRGSMFSGCITNRGEGDILLLDHLKILSSSEVSEITRGHSRVYQSRNSKTQTASAGSGGGSRSTYITFKIDGTYAVSISEVKEIIEYPRELLQPPGLRPHVRGVLNLRGELVTIIDAHLLYSNNESTEVTTPSSSSSTEVYYKVQIAAFKHEMADIDTPELRRIGKLSTVKMNDVNKYLVGDFVSRESAEIAREKLKNLGYKGAFLVVLNE